jgi:hypothetical protein
VAPPATSSASAATIPIHGSVRRFNERRKSSEAPSIRAASRPPFVPHASPVSSSSTTSRGRTLAPEDTPKRANAGAHPPPSSAACTMNMPRHPRARPRPRLCGLPRHLVHYAHTLKEGGHRLKRPAGRGFRRGGSRRTGGARIALGSSRLRATQRISSPPTSSRRWQAALARGQLGLCRLQLAPLRPGGPRLQQRAFRRPTGSGSSKAYVTPPPSRTRLLRQTRPCSPHSSPARSHVELVSELHSTIAFDFEQVHRPTHTLARFETALATSRCSVAGRQAQCGGNDFPHAPLGPFARRLSRAPPQSSVGRGEDHASPHSSSWIPQ